MLNTNKNENKITFRTSYFKELETIAINHQTTISKAVDQIICEYFNQYDQTLSLYSHIESTVGKLAQFSEIADEVSRKFSSMNSAEAYYFLRIKEQLDNNYSFFLSVNNKFDQLIQLLYLMTKTLPPITNTEQQINKDLRSVI